MNRIDVLKEYEELLKHNLLCYSADGLMEQPKNKFKNEWKDTKEKLEIISKMLEEEGRQNKMSFSLHQILQMCPKVQYYIENSNGGVIAGRIELEEAIECAEKHKREYLQDPLNSKLDIYVVDKNGKTVYIANGKNLEESEELE